MRPHSLRMSGSQEASAVRSTPNSTPLFRACGVAGPSCLECMPGVHAPRPTIARLVLLGASDVTLARLTSCHHAFTLAGCDAPTQMCPSAFATATTAGSTCVWVSLVCASHVSRTMHRKACLDACKHTPSSEVVMWYSWCVRCRVHPAGVPAHRNKLLQWASIAD